MLYLYTKYMLNKKQLQYYDTATSPIFCFNKIRDTKMKTLSMSIVTEFVNFFLIYKF